MKKLASLLLTLCMLWGFAAAEGIPQMVKVDFASINYTAPENPTDNFAPNPAGFSEDGLRYHDDTIDVQLHKFHVYNADVTAAFVQIAHPDQLRTHLAKPYPSKTTARITVMVKPINAVFAVNADWFTYRSDGIVYRNGELLRSREIPEDDGLIIDTDGNLHIVRPMTEEEYAKWDPAKIAQSFSFGPALVMNGEVLDIPNRKITYRQRMAIGQVDELCYVFVAADGTNDEDGEGLNVPELAQLMHDLGAHTAYNLDGGQSASMTLGRNKVNGHPQNMRAIGDIIYFATAVPGAEE